MDLIGKPFHRKFWILFLLLLPLVWFSVGLRIDGLRAERQRWRELEWVRIRNTPPGAPYVPEDCYAFDPLDVQFRQECAFGGVGLFAALACISFATARSGSGKSGVTSRVGPSPRAGSEAPPPPAPPTPPA
jgi:hypothetical protein